MKTHRLLAIGLTLVSSLLFAQGESPAKWKIQNFSLSNGFGHPEVQTVDQARLQRLNPGSDFAQLSFTGFKRQPYYNGNGMDFTGWIELYKKKDDGTAPHFTFRLGVSDSRYSVVGQEYAIKEEGRYDTLTSSGSGDQIFIDSSRTTIYSFDYRIHTTTLNFGTQISSNRSRRWSVYAGAEVQLGIATGRAQYKYKAWTRYDDEEVNGIGAYHELISKPVQQEEYSSGIGFAAGLVAPIGVQFRIAKENSFFTHTRLFMEFRPTLSMVSVPEGGSFTSALMFRNVGFKYDF